MEDCTYLCFLDDYRVCVKKKGIFTDPFCSSGRDVRWYDPALLGGRSLIGRRSLYTDDGGRPGLAEMSVHM